MHISFSISFLSVLRFRPQLRKTEENQQKRPRNRSEERAPSEDINARSVSSSKVAWGGEVLSKEGRGWRGEGQNVLEWIVKVIEVIETFIVIRKFMGCTETDRLCLRFKYKLPGIYYI